MKREKYRPAIEPPYRWRDWAAREDGISGDALKHFINYDETIRPDGSKGPGLLAYLRGLQSSNGDDRRDVIASVFAGVSNRMESGYLLRDVINKVNGIHFDSTEEIHTLGHLYESMLKEMRDAAGDSGEFYTPRAVVRLMVQVVNPQLGETILDPACGTGGFLVESFQHLEKQCNTVQDRRVLQEKSIFGNEAKPLPYMLAQMNLLLHGLESPQIVRGNSLAQKLTDITERDRVDMILTNPPFGGEEERGILGNFPEDKQTAETALLFLQLIMRKLRVTPKPGRAGVVVPNGTLSAAGVAMRIRRDLLHHFNVHTIVRLPQNVFSPYTDVATNLVFFDRAGPTREILYCQVPLPPGITLSKTRPLEYDALKPFFDIIRQRIQSDHSWFVQASDLNEDADLDIKNPKMTLGTLLPAEICLSLLASQIKDQEERIRRLRAILTSVLNKMKNAPLVPLGDLTVECDERIGDAYSPDVRLVGVTNVNGITAPKTPIGKDPQKYKRVGLGDLVYNPMRINVGSIGVATKADHTGITSPDYVVFRCRKGLLPEYVFHFLRSEAGQNAITRKTRGSVRFRLYYDRLATILIPVAEGPIQEELVKLCRENLDLLGAVERSRDAATQCLSAILRESFMLSHTPANEGKSVEPTG
jgi:type I restriction enzyme M protein